MTQGTGEPLYLQGQPALLVFAFRVGAALLLGAAIGAERELRDKPAGLRTHMLIAGGAAALGWLSATAAGAADPTRIASQVITGIGFLGAGVIMKTGSHVAGLTTAASIWAVCAVGLLTGLGYFHEAAVTTLLVFVTLVGVAKIETMALWRRKQRRILLHFRGGEVTLQAVHAAVKPLVFTYSVLALRRKVDGEFDLMFEFTAPRENGGKLRDALIAVPDVLEVASPESREDAHWL